MTNLAGKSSFSSLLSIATCRKRAITSKKLEKKALKSKKLDMRDGCQYVKYHVISAPASPNSVLVWCTASFLDQRGSWQI